MQLYFRLFEWKDNQIRSGRFVARQRSKRFADKKLTACYCSKAWRCLL